MPDLLDTVRAQTTPFSTGCVQNTSELQRIYHLPYRDWQVEAAGYPIDTIVQKMTAAFRTPNGTMTLRPLQAAALAELYAFGGVLVPGRVSAGKCVVAETEVFADGVRRAVGDLVGQRFNARTMREGGALCEAPATCFASGRKPCVRLTLSNGDTTEISTDHPVLTAWGWMRVDDVRSGDSIAVAGETEVVWARAIRLEDIGVHDVYDLSVPETGCFVGNNIVLHNTIPSFLAAAVVNAQRPLLFVPAKLRDKTTKEWLKLSADWQLPRIRVESYDMLGLVQNEHYLTNYRPDIIISDEVHKLRRTNTSRTKRVTAYMRENPNTYFMGLSGTITKRSIRDYWHILRWCLKDRMPLPRDVPQLSAWSEFLDSRRNEDPRQVPNPGALVSFCTEAERFEIAQARAREAAAGADEVTKKELTKRVISIVRQAFERRLTGTPGVISSLSDTVDCSLILEQKSLDLSHLEPYYTRLRTAWEVPNGDVFTEAVDLWRHARELSCGMYYIWDPPAPKDWLEARRTWCAYVRHTLAHRHKYHSELHVAKGIVNGDLDDAVGRTAYAAWAQIRKTFKPNTVAVWVDDVTLKATAEWLFKRGEPPGLAWVEHVEFGRRLSQMTGLPYFGAGGLDAQGRSIEDESYKGPCILSISANNEGRNLQTRYSRNLIVSCPPSGDVIEQLLGRTHRDGQDADEVSAEFFLSCREQYDGFQYALKDAQYIQDTTRQPQKLLNCDLAVMSVDEAARQTGALWR